MDNLTNTEQEELIPLSSDRKRKKIRKKIRKEPDKATRKRRRLERILWIVLLVIFIGSLLQMLPFIKKKKGPGFPAVKTKTL